VERKLEKNADCYDVVNGSLVCGRLQAGEAKSNDRDKAESKGQAAVTVGERVRGVHTSKVLQISSGASSDDEAER